MVPGSVQGGCQPSAVTAEDAGPGLVPGPRARLGAAPPSTGRPARTPDGAGPWPARAEAPTASFCGRPGRARPRGAAGKEGKWDLSLLCPSLRPVVGGSELPRGLLPSPQTRAASESSGDGRGLRAERRPAPPRSSEQKEGPGRLPEAPAGPPASGRQPPPTDPPRPGARGLTCRESAARRPPAPGPVSSDPANPWGVHPSGTQSHAGATAERAGQAAVPEVQPGQASAGHPEPSKPVPPAGRLC